MTTEKFIDHLEEIGDLIPYKVVIIKCFDEHYTENQSKEYVLHELICFDEEADLWIWENDWYEGQEYDIVGYYNIDDININCCAVHKLPENKDFVKCERGSVYTDTDSIKKVEDEGVCND